jgi:hypothetical protein
VPIAKGVENKLSISTYHQTGCEARKRIRPMFEGHHDWTSTCDASSFITKERLVTKGKQGCLKK